MYYFFMWLVFLRVRFFLNNVYPIKEYIKVTPFSFFVVTNNKSFYIYYDNQIKKYKLSEGKYLMNVLKSQNPLSSFHEDFVAFVVKSRNVGV